MTKKKSTNKPRGSKVKGKETKPATKKKAPSKKRKSEAGPKRSAAKVKKPIVATKKNDRKGEVHKRGMTDRAWKFCHEYVRIGIKYLAAISAGYAEKTAPSTATTLLKNPKVIAKIKELQEKSSKKMEVTIEKVVSEYAKLAFTDITDILDMSTGYPRFKDLEMIKPEHLAALQSVGVSVNGIKYKMHDKKGALDSLSKKLGIFKDQKLVVEHTIGNISKKDAKKVKSVFDDITEE